MPIPVFFKFYRFGNAHLWLHITLILFPSDAPLILVMRIHVLICGLLIASNTP